MNLVLVCTGPAALRATRDDEYLYQDHLALIVALDGARGIRLPDGTHLGDHPGTLRIQNALEREARAPDETPINAIFWDDPAKDSLSGSVPSAASCEASFAVSYYAVQLEVSPSLYFAILVALGAQGTQLFLELEVPDLDAAARSGTVRFEDLYSRGMSRVSAFALSVTRAGGPKESLLPETWPAGFGPNGVVMW